LTEAESAAAAVAMVAASAKEPFSPFSASGCLLAFPLFRRGLALVLIGASGALTALLMAIALDRFALTRKQAALGATARPDLLRIEQDATVMRSMLVTGDELLRQARAVLVAEQSHAVSKGQRNIAQEMVRLSQRSYEAGKGTSFHLVDTAQKARSAEVDLAVKEFTVVQSKFGAMLAHSNCDY
jgi:hypothetical protein